MTEPTIVERSMVPIDHNDLRRLAKIGRDNHRDLAARKAFSRSIIDGNLLLVEHITIPTLTVLE